MLLVGSSSPLDPRGLLSLVLLCSPLSLTACNSDASGSGGTDSDTGDDEAGGTQGAELPAPVPRVYRLTHEQWENTTRDLFGLPGHSGLSSLFRDDPLVAGYIFDNDATSLEVDEAYARSATELASDALRRSYC